MNIGKKLAFRTLLVLAPLALGGCLNVETTHPAQPTSTTVVVPPTTTTTMAPATSSTTSTTTTVVCPNGAMPPC